MQNFKETFDEIAKNVSVNKSGKKVKSFSKSDYEKMAKSLINDKDYTAAVVTTVKGKEEKKEIQPVKELRDGLVKSILISAGHDKAEAAALAQSMEITNVGGLYEFKSELDYNYLKAGKRLNFLPKEDFNASLVIDEKEAREVKYRDLKTKEEKTSYQGAYLKLVSSSSCPKGKKGKKK